MDDHVSLPAHSSLGASGMERWANCPGSVALLRELDLPESDEPDYRADGTAAHEAAALCLYDKRDAWEIVGEEIAGRPITEDMANAVQVYLDECRQFMGDDWKHGVEFHFHEPSIHEKFYGTADFWAVSPDGMELVIRDFKFGQGITVEVIDNPQVRYYALGVLLHHPDVGRVDLGIVQPRAFHVDGPIRTDRVTADSIGEWAEATLLPAMARTELDHSLDAGPWCRFCPAKLVCPLLTSLFGAAAKADPTTVINLSDESLGRSYQYTEAVKFYLRALEEETYRRLNQGRAMTGVKLVWKKANRVWKEGAAELFKNRFGVKALEEPELKSPASMAKINPEAKKLVTEWAYTPQTGLTVALEHDPRPGVKVTTSAEVFGNYVGEKS